MCPESYVSIFGSIGDGISGVFAFIAMMFAIYTFRTQAQSSRELHTEQQRLSQSIHDAQQALARALHAEQAQLSQRQILLPLWEHLRDLKRIDPTQPILPDVLKAVNTLELVALCCEGNMVDTALIRRTFRDTFLKLYEDIKASPRLPGIDRSGPDLLRVKPCRIRFVHQIF